MTAGRKPRLSERCVIKGLSLTPRVWKATKDKARRKGYSSHSRYIESLIRKDLGADWPEHDVPKRYRDLGLD